MVDYNVTVSELYNDETFGKKLSFTLSDLAFPLSFFYHSVKFFQTVFDDFFSIALLSVNLIQFRGYDIE